MGIDTIEPSAVPIDADVRATGERPRKLRVPRTDRSVLAVPAMDCAAAAIGRNAALLDGSAVPVQGRTLGHLREWSRRCVLAAAAEYTGELTGVPGAPVETAAVVMSGHQPTLFHPGVWIKNFAAGHLATTTGGTAVNLVIDNDLLSSTGIRVPTGDRNRPVVESIAFDSLQAPAPWEEVRVQNADRFRSFGERVAQRVRAWNIEPVLERMWPAAVETLERDGRLRDCLTVARVSLERDWGLRNLELPISRLCSLDPFLWFASCVLAQLPRFRKIHNACLDEYRRRNRVRSRSHPVPELTYTDGWHEAPFWVWRTGAAQRSRVFARQAGCDVELSDGSETFARLKLSPDMDACCAVEGLRELPARGLRFRTRALTTTLFTRLCACDLFIHGVGGSKYDEMTDRIIERFFGLQPPEFQTLSATLHLPLAEPFDVTVEDERRLQRLLRDLEHNPDRHAALDAENELIARKRQLIDRQHNRPQTGASQRERRAARESNRRRFSELQHVNRQLQSAVADQRRRIAAELAETRSRMAANAVLTNREFAFCLQPADRLSAFVPALAGDVPA